MRIRVLGRTIIAGAAALCLAGAAPVVSDEFLRGYAAAVLARDFQIPLEAVSVRDGVITVRARLAESERERVVTALQQIAGVAQVVVEPPADEPAEAAPAVVEVPAAPRRWTWLPARQAFRPLIADPRWPRFAAAYDYYIDDAELSSVGNVSFGESFSLLQYDAGGIGIFQTGIQGGVFSIFDLTSSSVDLVNADYFVALPLAYSRGNASALLRVFHQSSHLGDEYLLRSAVERVNLSYEGLNLLLSYEWPIGLRTYGGAGYLFRVEPSEIQPWSLQFGLEYLGERFDWPLPARPVAAVDLQVLEEGGWTANVAPMAGLQFGTERGGRRTLRLLAQYFNGQSPNGQFYDRHIQYLGVGVQLSL